MSRVIDQEALLERVRNLGAFNGFKLAFVEVHAQATPPHALLDVEFHNANHLSPLPVAGDFAISGGTRLRGGSAPGQVRVSQVEAAAGTAPNMLRLRVEPIGDYSTYTLRVTAAGFDPLLRDLPFKFRPGCFNLNCAPAWQPGAARAPEPAIDYLARDYDSLRHLLMAAMAQRVPGWQPTSEADLDQVLIDLLAADGDELADYQDRVANEAYLATARGRIALARHGRLMDYHIHQGNQAATWLALEVSVDTAIPRDWPVWTGPDWRAPGAVIFATERAKQCRALLNRFELYSWSDSVTALAAGATEADLTRPGMSQAQAEQVRDLLLGPEVDEILIQEQLNPHTGQVNGRDQGARQVLRLLPRNGALPRAEALADPVAAAPAWMVRVRWVAQDALRRNYCFATTCNGSRIGGVSRFYGNLARVTHGRPWRTVFRAPGTPLAGLDSATLRGSDEAWFERTQLREGFPDWGVLCRLSQAPLAWLDTPPGGETPVRSSLRVTVSGLAAAWREQSDLIESDGDDAHYMVETDELGASRLRFGNASNGRALPPHADITCDYRVGQGVAGNIGPDALNGFDAAAAPAVLAVWNPLDALNGREPEPVEEIRRRVPEAYRQRQLRAVTLADYAARAEELPRVAHARAAYAWTGSWRTVRVAIDPAAGAEFTPELAAQVRDWLDAVRLIGEDLEIRPPQFVALDIEVLLCAHADYWPEHLQAVLEQEFSDGLTPDGRPGLFHPDLWSFGQALHASQIIGRALAVPGVERVLRVSMRRLNAGRGAGVVVSVAPEDLPRPVVEKLAAGPFEIIQVANDPSRLEAGRILFDIRGGRR